MSQQACARVVAVAGGGKVEEAEAKASAAAAQAVSGACALCGAAPLEAYTKSGTQFRDHYRCPKHGADSGACPYKETVVALAVRACVLVRGGERAWLRPCGERLAAASLVLCRSRFGDFGCARHRVGCWQPWLAGIHAPAQVCKGRRPARAAVPEHV